MYNKDVLHSSYSRVCALRLKQFKSLALRLIALKASSFLRSKLHSRKAQAVLKVALDQAALLILRQSCFLISQRDIGRGCLPRFRKERQTDEYERSRYVSALLSCVREAYYPITLFEIHVKCRHATRVLRARPRARECNRWSVKSLTQRAADYLDLARTCAPSDVTDFIAPANVAKMRGVSR